MYERILLPVDGSDGATAMVHHAGELAAWAEATVTLLFVADTGRDSVTVVGGDVVDALAREGEDVVDAAAETLATHGVDSETDVVQGDPAPTIVEYAERYDHDLIALPTHGRQGISRYLLGSVTEKVVRLSSRPVLSAQMRPDERFAFPYDSVLLPTDGSAPARRAARHALRLAASLGATVHVLSVVEDSSFGLPSAIPGDQLENVATDAIQGVVREARAYDLPDVVTHVEHGRPANQIRDAIDEYDVGAVVLGTTGRRGADRILLGSVAEKTVRSAPVPVVTVPRPRPESE